jgi:hypothetical protein
VCSGMEITERESMDTHAARARPPWEVAVFF